ncbi:16S rRNA (uracil(1498)-N(3))-methyltransferase [Microbacterium sp. NPDC089189]|uniref:16S rRNA (uracil(1498)-N(3))-methyltransferase n=1 Tax=Microbacterium sp. NPDC089189 TaxID=3154972 RepID=UPI003430535C
MALHFLLDDAADAVPGGLVVLTGAEAHHAATVRRVRVGEDVTVGDGRGVWARGVCETVAPREVTVRIAERDDVPPASPRVVLAQALAKGDRDELAVQAATELGVAAVIPWQATRSVSRWDAAKTAKGRARWAGIVREAAKQAHRAWVPDVEDALSTAALARRIDGVAALVLEPTAQERLTARVRELAAAGATEIVLIVGPEGGIDPAEIATLVAAGARAVRMGDSVLRTSTAGPAAIAALDVALGRW